MDHSQDSLPDKSAPKTLQGPDLHRKAFEVFYETRNKSAAGRAAGVTYVTIMNWAYEGYNCRFGCPWHGWDKLIEEKEAALTAQMKMLDQGIYDPVRIEKGMQDAARNPNAERMFAINKVVRSDMERIGHYEYLYAKVFFHLTGISVAPDNADGFTSEQLDEHCNKYLDKYKQGLILTNFEAGMRVLNSIVDKIKELRNDLGVKDKEDELEGGGTVTIEELRTLRKTIKLMPSSQLDDLMSKKVIIDEPQYAEVPKAEAG